jgi:hypothetical protein
MASSLPPAQVPSIFSQVLDAPPSLSAAHLDFLGQMLLNVSSALRELAFIGAGVVFLYGIVRLILSALDKQNGRSEGHKPKAVRSIGLAVLSLVLLNVGLFLFQSFVIANL